MKRWLILLAVFTACSVLHLVFHDLLEETFGSIDSSSLTLGIVMSLTTAVILE